METYVREKAQSQVMVNSFITSVYNWMAVGLALTAATAFVVLNSLSLLQIVFPMRWILFIGEIGLVVALVARIDKMSGSTATTLFLVYSAINGLILAPLFVRGVTATGEVMVAANIGHVFTICAATFAACSIYGMVTKKDLTSVGNFMIMGLIGIIIASIANYFFKSEAMHMIISYVGVLVFVGLTAYDTQKLKMMAMTQPDGLEAGVVRKGAIMGALSLYLDFLNMFIFLYSILGGDD